ncbi:TIGR01777 family oxidoreductase [Pseudobdellovibrio exovorus]|uniref:Cell division inhibitor SULA n=1 Tax=Pseudobdellovibrio exovorus JSS TaxID=1184267 RepID=M4VC68_9BACT|nr:TIGR01777 family oxidoreductase [Pseudobdellovibrio exovorus]AGH95626.1 cell division inhibitor SULA [Pseudobdellovibrio exovorus JSS]
MKILLTGATGLVGNDVGKQLVERGHTVVAVTRNRIEAQQKLSYKAEIIECDLTRNILSHEAFVGVDAIVNLMGESVDGRWTSKKKEKIRKSRVMASKHLLQNCPEQVKTIVSASAIGLYGDRGEESLTESSEVGQGFLSEVCQLWEGVIMRASIERKVILRLGMVLSRKGGALKKLLSIFNRNLGAELGSGNQWMSFIALDDLVNLICEAVENKQYNGVINAVSGNPVRNKDFTESLCQFLEVKKMPRAPEFALKIALGQMSELVLSSQRVTSSISLELGFAIKYPDLESILNHELSHLKKGCSLFYAEQFIPHGVDEVFDFFSNHENLEKITPSFLNFKIQKASSPKVQQDSIIDYRLKVRGVPVRWRTLIRRWEPPYYFADMQVRGPYAYWDHSHSFKKVVGGTLMVDEVCYKLPLGSLGKLVAAGFVESDVGRIFQFRRKVISTYDFRDKSV